jgi:SulP family sulfate permease
MAIGLSLLRHVNHSYRPHSGVMVPGPTGRWERVAATPGIQTEPGLIVYRFGADLFYANVDRFADQVRALVDRAPVHVRHIVVDAGAITDLDYAAGKVMRTLIHDLDGRGTRLIIARASQFLRADLARHGITALLGEERIFATLHEGVSAAQQAGASSGVADHES